MDVTIYNSENVQERLKYFLINQKHGTVLWVHNFSSVLTPRKSIVDEKICNELGYVVYEAFYSGGVMVSQEGDISITHFGKTGNGFLEKFNSHFADWLKSKDLNVTLVGNDILVDGYKICGTTLNHFGKIDYTALHIGINTNIEHIKKICKKPMVKVPKGLSEYGITTEEVEKMFLDFCKQFED